MLRQLRSCLPFLKKIFKAESAANIAQQFVNIKFDRNETINVFVIVLIFKSKLLGKNKHVHILIFKNIFSNSV